MLPSATVALWHWSLAVYLLNLIQKVKSEEASLEQVVSPTVLCFEAASSPFIQPPTLCLVFVFPPSHKPVPTSLVPQMFCSVTNLLYCTILYCRRATTVNSVQPGIFAVLIGLPFLSRDAMFCKGNSARVVPLVVSSSS